MLSRNRFLAQTSLTELFCLRCLPTAPVIPVLPNKLVYSLKINYRVGYTINIRMYFVGHLYIVHKRRYLLKHITLSHQPVNKLRITYMH